MRIACLQFAPQLGDVDQNLNRADAVLSKANPKDIDLLVLPELAFTGYNFKSLKDISPYLEPTTAGISSLWARTTALKYECLVVVGYPEKVDVSYKWPTSPEYYNSAIIVNNDGETIGNYRKTHLYYTDETWALEGNYGFYESHIRGLGNVAVGICMDLNPYKFEAPWDAWEFGYHILHSEANLAIVSMAWLTREDARSYSRTPKEPDMETLAYWVARLEPLIRLENDEEIIVVLANRTGVEGDAVYAGTSAVLGVQNGEVKLYGVLGRGERELLVVDTSKRPQAKLVSDTTWVRPDNVSDSTNSASTRESEYSQNTTTTSTTNTSFNTLPDLDTFQQSIDEILADPLAVAPVEPAHIHHFHHTEPIDPHDYQRLTSTISAEEEHRSILKSSNAESYRDLKSAVNGINRHDNAATPGDDFERPCSPKSRNASRNRQHVRQEQALYSHDLADDDEHAMRPASRTNGFVGRSISRPVPGSNHVHESSEQVGGVANDLGLLAVNGDSGSAARPKSTGW